MNSLDKNKTIKDAIELLDASEKKLLVILERGKVLGTISDGDMRRHFLRGGLLSDVVSKAMNSEPKVYLKDDLVKLPFEKIPLGVEYLVIVDNKNSYLGLHRTKKSKNSLQLSSTAVLMAGGMGARLRPVTIDTPKPMVKIKGVPILERQITQLKKHGFFNFYISVNYLAEQIIDYFKNGEKLGVNIRYVHEKKRLGTAGALSLIKDNIEENFLLMNGDILTDIDFTALKKFHMSRNSMMSIAAINHHLKVPFGVLKVKDDLLVGVKEKPVYSDLCNAGIYMVNKNVLKTIPANEYTDITDTIENIMKSGDKVSVFLMYESWSDVGTPEDLIRVEREFDV